MAKIVNQFAHIFIHYYSNKTASACKLFISEPTQNQERLLGRLFGILEINIPSRENARLINQIINDLEELYYSQAENEVDNFEQYFEETLKTINQKFNQLIKDKQIILVGNLNENTIKEKINLTVGIIKDNDLYLSYLNNINIFLIHKTKQDYKIIDIKKIARTENNGNGDKTDYPNLFANLISGQVEPADYLFVANGNFLEYVSLERTQKIITSLPLHKAAEYFKNSLLQYEGNNFAAIIIKNSITETETETAKEPASLTSITELNYTESLTEKLLAPSFWNYFKNIYQKISSLINKKGAAPIGEEKNKVMQEPASDEKSAKASSGLKTFIPKIILPLKNTIQPIKKFFKNIFSKNIFLSEKLDKIKNRIRLKFAFLSYWLKKIPNLSKILLVIAGLMLILFVYSISYLKHQQSQTISQKEYQNLISQIEDMKNQAESDLIYGDETKAREEIVQAQSLLASLPIESNKQKEIHENLSDEVEKIIAKLRHITVIEEPILIADLTAFQENNIDIQNLIYLNNTLIAFDSLNNNNYFINLENREVKNNLSNLSDIGPIIKAKNIGDKILIYHGNNGFVQYKDGKYSPFSVALNPQGKLADFSFYNSRLYTTDYVANQIYRLSKIEAGYGQGLAWLKNTQDLKDITAMAIDINIWLLDKTGKILKFNKGVKQNFELKNVEPALEAPNQLFTNDQTNYIYILEAKNKRIVVIDKSGNLITQYFNESFNNLRDFALVEKEKKMFVVTDNLIYFFNLTHL